MPRKPIEQRTYSRSKRKMQILNVFKIAAQHEDFEPKSMADVGRLISLPASTHLLAILHEMAEAGDLVESWRDIEGKKGAYVFSLSPDIIVSKFSRRHIAVKSRGVAVGQLEMFS